MPEKNNSEITEYLIHYKKSIDKNQDDRERIYHCLTRLSKLKVSVDHLQATGIGKTVNNVSKLSGEVGNLAKSIVNKWKCLVAESEKAKPNESLFKLPTKLDHENTLHSPQKLEPQHDRQTNSSHQSSHRKSSQINHYSSSGNKDKITREKDEKKEKSKESLSKSNSVEKSSKSSTSSSKHRHDHGKSHHHSKSSRKEDDTLKRKHEKVLVGLKEKDQSSSKKLKLETKAKPDAYESKPPSKIKSKKTIVEADEMDGSQGMGFAEALMLFDIPSTSRKKDINLADKMTKVVKSDPTSESKKSLKVLTAVPKLLTEKPKLRPLPDIVTDLPSDISIPDYRPLPLSSAVKDYINSSLGNNSYLRPQPKFQTEADLLTESFSSKANRTRVFSGNRTQKTIPSLFELCIRILQENIEYLTETGGVPFDILRPVLEKAKPDQLQTIEFYNSYLLEDSDVLWEPHCKRMFRSRKREEMESWREMYERCIREDEEKLNRLTRNIKQHQEKADEGVQKTRLAFIDSMVKPPRNVMRKQEIYGTNKKLVASPAMRTSGLKHIMPNLAAAGDARLRVAAGLRDDAQHMVGRGSFARNNVKKAPLMAKILSKFKR